MGSRGRARSVPSALLPFPSTQSLLAADDPTLSISKRRRLLDNDASASSQPRPQSSKDAVNGHTASKLPASRSANAVDTTRLLDLGLGAFEVDAIQRVLRPSIEPDSSNTDRSMDVKARFGFLSSDKAKAALEAQETVKAFPYDPKRQQRYEAFLRAQAGEDQAYFTVRPLSLSSFPSRSTFFLPLTRPSPFPSRSSSLNCSSSVCQTSSSSRRPTNHSSRRRDERLGGRGTGERGEEEATGCRAGWEQCSDLSRGALCFSSRGKQKRTTSFPFATLYKPPPSLLTTPYASSPSSPPSETPPHHPPPPSSPTLPPPSSRSPSHS